MSDTNDTPAPGDDRDGPDASEAQTRTNAQASDSTKWPSSKAVRVTDARPELSAAKSDKAQDSRTETGESGETGVLTNAEFIAAIVCDTLPEGVFGAVCAKAGDPENGGYTARRWNHGDDPSTDGTLNAFFNCGVFSHGKDGSFRARLDRCAGVLFLMLDDLGTKVPLERLEGVTPTWLIETSPGNFQAGLAFAGLADGDTATAIHEAMIAAGLCDAGARQPKNRWARLPHAINGKPKYEREGRPWRCKLAAWDPNARFTADQLIAAFDLELQPASAGKRRKAKSRPKHGQRLIEPACAENPVIAALKAKSLYKSDLGGGKHDITCPWVSEHTDAKDNGTAYFESSDEFPIGGFHCMHSHGDRFTISHLLEFLGVTPAAASGLPLIRILPGELHRVVAAGEELLAADGSLFQRGDPAHIVSIARRDGGAAIVVVSEEGLLLALSQAARWERWDVRSAEWAVCDPPPRHVKALWRGGKLARLARLEGLARQPFFDQDGVLVTEPGYHSATERFGVFSGADFVFPADFSRVAAQHALALMTDLLREFSFVSEHDHAAALAAMLTAATRPSLPVAPAFHIRAPEYGSGKSYLADLIALFAGPAAEYAAKMSYPATSEEATKTILAALLAGPAAIVFDDMAVDWIPHGAVNRMLTSPMMSDRILGESRIAQASTRTLVLGTGNNVGPTGDLLRRVLTIHLDHGVERPATKTYAGDPVGDVTRERAKYVAAALTIIAAHRAAGAPKFECKALAGFGEWSTACRQPLLWLGLPDPAERIFENMGTDPTRDCLGALLEVWFKTFGDAATTVRAAIKRAAHYGELFEAIDDMGAVERGEVNPRKLGWALNKAAGRTVGGLKLTAARADGRLAWRVTSVQAPPVSPVPPVYPPESEATANCDDAASQEVDGRDRITKRGAI